MVNRFHDLFWKWLKGIDVSINYLLYLDTNTKKSKKCQKCQKINNALKKETKLYLGSGDWKVSRVCIFWTCESYFIYRPSISYWGVNRERVSCSKLVNSTRSLFAKRFLKENSISVINHSLLKKLPHFFPCLLSHKVIWVAKLRSTLDYCQQSRFANKMVINWWWQSDNR